MRRVHISLVVAGLLLVVPRPATAATIDFDDLPETFDDALPSPYQGFDWENFRYYSFDDNAGFPTWQNGIVSQPNAAYSGGEIGTDQIVGVISRAAPFDFISAYLGAPNYATMNVTVQGLLGNVVLYSQVVTVDNNGADQFTFNFLNIDRVRIFGSDTANDPCGDFNCSQFSVDDLEFGPPTLTAVPEPSSVSLLGLGALALLRRRLSRRG